MTPERYTQWRQVQEQCQALNRLVHEMHGENCDGLEDGEAIHSLASVVTKAVRIANTQLEKS